MKIIFILRTSYSVQHTAFFILCLSNHIGLPLHKTEGRISRYVVRIPPCQRAQKAALRDLKTYPRAGQTFYRPQAVRPEARRRRVGCSSYIPQSEIRNPHSLDPLTPLRRRRIDPFKRNLP